MAPECWPFNAAGTTELIEAVGALGNPAIQREVTVKALLLHVLRGHCNSPIAGFARVARDGALSLRACVFSAGG